MYNYGFRYIEGANLFRDFGGHMDEYYDKIYTLENGNFVLLYSGEYGAEDNSKVEYGDDGMPVYRYFWENEEVSSEEYERKLNEVYDTEKEIKIFQDAQYDSEKGRYVGNGLCDYQEIIEAIEALKGNMQEDVRNVVLELGAYILKLDGKGNDIEENKKAIEEVISNGKAYKKFLELVANQGGDISYIEDTEKFEKAKYKLPVIAEKSGYVKSLNAEEVGKIAMHLGAGRLRKEDDIDYSVGVELVKKVGDHIDEKETIAYIYANDEEKGKEAVSKLLENYQICAETVEKPSDILEIIE